MIGAPAHDTRAKPPEIRSRRRRVGFPFDLPGSIGRQKLPEILRRPAALTHTTMRQFVGPHKHLEIFFGVYRAPRLEQHNRKATLREDFGGHSAARPRADYTHVVH